MSMQLPKEAERYSWADYLAWSEGERYELIDGVAYAMSPAPRRRHQETSRAIFRQIDGSLVGKPCEAYFAPFDVKLSAETDDDAPTVVQPDITVTCDRTKLTEQGMTGPPDLVIEVVSPDSEDERVVEVYRLGTDGSYRRIGAFGPEDTVAAEAVPDLAISLKEVFPEAT